MYIAMSKFIVANQTDDAVRQAFIQRPHLVDDAPGFIRMEVMNPVEAPAEFWLLTWWQDEASWKTWFKGHQYKQAHSQIPKGLKLIPRTTEVRGFNLLCS